MADDKVSNDNQKTDLDNIMSQIVLQQPWNGGYGGFDSVSAMDAHNGVPRPPRNQPQLRFDSKRDALTIMAGVYTVYDDNGYYDGGWDILPDAQRLAIPRAALVDLVKNRTYGQMTVPSELTKQNGKRTFDFTPKLEQYDAIENMEELDETVLPLSFGSISCNFSYGTLKLTLVPREDKKIGLIVGEYTQNGGVTNQRDTKFFSDEPPEFKKYIVFYSERSVGSQCNDDNIIIVESPIRPTERLLRQNGFMSSGGTCTNVSYPGCEECGDSTITGFKVENYSLERVLQLQAIDTSAGSKDATFHLGNYIHRRFDDTVHRLEKNI